MNSQPVSSQSSANKLPANVWWVMGFIGVVWGSNFITMKMATDYITPMQVVLVRVFFGFMPIALYASYKGVLRWQHLRFTHHFIVMSLLATVVYYYGFASGSALLESGIAGAISGAIPLFTMLCSFLFLRGETVSFNQLVSVLLGFSAVLLLMNPFHSNLQVSALEGGLYVLLGAFSVGSSFVYATYYITPLKISSLALTTYQLGFGLLWLLLLTDFNGLALILIDDVTFWSTSLGLGLLGTGCAYLCYYYLIDAAGAVIASSTTYIPPIIALLIGAFWMDENISMADFLATAVIMLSVVLMTYDRPLMRFIHTFTRYRHKRARLR